MCTLHSQIDSHEMFSLIFLQNLEFIASLTLINKNK